MKAAVLEEVKQPLVVREAEKPDPGKGEVLVKLKTAALNHRDVWIQKGRYPDINTPVILGSDGAGVVVEVGEGVSEYWLEKE
uniref:alcohol dehydrogenase catalytic domain-containing protein n=1 Tax=Persicitalea sp. TaxID=3100273 RepID=UPI0035942FBB